MNITDSDVESGSPAPATDDSESLAGTATSRAPNMSAIPTDQPPVPSQSGMNGAGHGPSQYQTLADRAPSNPASTATMQQSPTLAHRQEPGVPGIGGMTMTPEMLTSELNRIPPSTLTRLKQDLGMPDKDLTIMTPEEKMQLVRLFHRGTAMRPPNVTAPGPSSMPPPTQMRGFPSMGPPGAQRWQTLQFQTQPIGRSTTDHWQASSAGRQSPPLARRQVSGTSDAAGTTTTPEMLAAELDRIPPPTLAKLKRKLGMAGKDLAAMTPEEQTKLVQLFRQGTAKRRNAPGPSNTGMALGQQPQLPAGPPAGRGQHAQPMYRLEPLEGQPRHPPLPPNGTMVRQGPMQVQGGQFNAPPMAGMSNPMLGHGLTTPQMGPTQHPMNPLAMQPGHGMHLHSTQMQQYRQAMQSMSRSQSTPQYTMLPATTVPRGPGMAALPPSAATPTMSNQLPPPPPPSGPSRNPSYLHAPMSPGNITEFTSMIESALMDEGGVDFERDFAAWFNPGPDNAHGP